MQPGRWFQKQTKNYHGISVTKKKPRKLLITHKIFERSPKIAPCEVTPSVTRGHVTSRYRRLFPPLPFFFLLKPEKPRGWGTGHLSLLNFIFSTTFKKENLPNSLQILRNVFIKWSYRLFSVKGCSSLKRKFCTSCAYRRATHGAGLAAHSEVRSLFRPGSDAAPLKCRT